MTENAAIKVILDKLNSSSAVTSKLDTYGISPNTHPMIINSALLPEEWDVKSRTLNLYTISGLGRLEYNRYHFTINCRSTSYSSSRDLAYAVYNVVHRISTDDFSAVATIGGTLLPSDVSIDNYNTPVEIIVRSV